MSPNPPKDRPLRGLGKIVKDAIGQASRSGPATGAVVINVNRPNSVSSVTTDGERTVINDNGEIRVIDHGATPGAADGDTPDKCP